MTEPLKAKERPELSAFSWEDPFLLDSQLEEEERMIRDTAHAFAQNELQPRVIDAFSREVDAPELFPMMGQAGLLGATAVLVCFGVIVWRGLRTTLAAPDRFGVLLALGLTMMVAIQAFVNISVVLGLMPTKGIPLPFVSAGGSSLLISLLGMGILLNVSQHASADA